MAELVRRCRLKIDCRKACGFESRSGYFSTYVIRGHSKIEVIPRLLRGSNLFSFEIDTGPVHHLKESGSLDWVQTLPQCWQVA